MLLTKTRPRRIIATTLAMLMLSNIVLPAVTYALTSGPTAPEATSFEPIDTTDMVNLQTGDFTYNMPLLEVPGPEGGYPLSLSYHAGIQPNEDASWVGLGWTLNPGAISRNVNGYPDDWYNPSTNSQVYLEAGVTSTYSVGVSVGLANITTVGAGLAFSNDTYKGFGVAGTFSLGVGKQYQMGTVNANIGIGITASTDGSTNVYGGASVGVGKGLNASVGLGFSTNFESLNAGISGDIGYSGRSQDGKHAYSGSLLKTSINTGGGKPSLSVGGLSASANATQQAGVELDNFSLSVDIPIYYFNVSLGYSKTRYWIDKSTNIVTHGSLNGSGWAEGTDGDLTKMVKDDVAYDSYSLLEDPKDKSIIEYPDPNKVQGGAYPDFDQYSVNAQGLGGSMRPYLFQGEVLGQNKKNANGDKMVNYYSPIDVNNPIPQFRFEGDFSNSYRQDYPDYGVNASKNLRLFAPPFGTPTYGNGDGTYGYSGNKLAGSKHIDVGIAVKPSNVKGYVKTDRYSSGMIEGFSITNESGVTYHYGLPAYSWDEENYQEKIPSGGQVYLNRGKKANPYAYTWYLTTITGPDFVDRDAPGSAGYGIASDADWGYWVNFEYGKWSNNYVWRNPSEGYRRDEDNEFQNASMGRKEVYYLNAIRTRTHVAIFEKDIRQDGKGSSPEIYNKYSTQDYQYSGLFNINSSQSLRLNKIYLLNVADANLVSSSSGDYTSYRPTLQRSVPCSDCELAANVIDKIDVETVDRSLLEAKAVRVIDFGYDYSLCSNTANSFDINSSSLAKEGKLTLLDVVFRGKGGAIVLPPTKFEYELSIADQKSQSGVNFTSGNQFTTTNGTFDVGDLLSVSGNNGNIAITSKSGPSSGIYTYTGSNYYNIPIPTGTFNITTTKNPRYNKDAYDLWGMYKSDADVNKIAANENFGRLTTNVSGKSTDAWSLRKIVSGLGSAINIEYESKAYQSVLNDNGSSSIIIEPTLDATPYVKIRFPELEDFVYAMSNYRANDKVCFVALFDVPIMFLDQNNQWVGANIPAVIDSRLLLPNMQMSSFELLSKSIITNITYSNFKTALASNIAGDPVFKMANFLSGKTNHKIGGGIRVKQISVNDNSGTLYTTSYDYLNPMNGDESGVSTYEPNVFDICVFPSDIAEHDKAEYRKALYKDINSLLAVSREIPPPGVMNEYVKVTTSIKNSLETIVRTNVGSTQYQFEVFRANMVFKSNNVTPYTHNSSTWGTMDSRNVVIKKFLHSIGSTKRITQFDKDGKKLSETINHFLHDGLESQTDSLFFVNYKNRLSLYTYLGNTYNLNFQGFLQERYSEAKTVDEKGWTAASQVKSTMSAREDYPCVPLGQTVINYVNGTQTTSQNLAFDFYSGALTKSVETDSYGNRIMTETTPAYRKYSAMGLKVSTGTNKNMLTQAAGTTIYKVDATNTPLGVVASSADVWSNTIPSMSMGGAQLTQNGGAFESKPAGDVWRLQSSYSWMPVNVTTDGLTPYASFSAFDYTTPSSSAANWKKTSEVTLNDVYSKALEAKDMNGNYAATRMNYGSRKVELSGSPSSYYEMAYSGVEDDNINQTANGFVKKVDGIAVSTAGVAHTGSRSLKLGTGSKKGFVYTIECNKLTAGRDYMASVWVKPVSGTDSDVKLYYDKGSSALGTSISSGSSTETAGSWKLINLKISGSDITAGATINIGCRNDHGSAEAYVDDFRFQPFNAATTAYVYDSFSGELSYILDNNNLYTKYEYDAAGRLIKTYKEKLGIGELKTGEYQYHYGSLSHYSSQAIRSSFKKNNCAVGQAGSNVSIDVAEGMFTSTISQEDADAKAADYAQVQANLQGTCHTASATLKLLNNLFVNGLDYEASLINGGNGSGYLFPQIGGTNISYSITPGTYSIYVDPRNGPGAIYTITLYDSGGAHAQTGSQVSWNNISVQDGATISIKIN